MAHRAKFDLGRTEFVARTHVAGGWNSLRSHDSTVAEGTELKRVSFSFANFRKFDAVAFPGFVFDFRVANIYFFFALREAIISFFCSFLFQIQYVYPSSHFARNNFQSLQSP